MPTYYGDEVSHLKSVPYGLKVLLYDRPYNRDFSHPDITRVNNWKQIHEILVK